MSLPQLSIVVPLGPEESEQESLFETLLLLPSTEVIFCASGQSEPSSDRYRTLSLQHELTWQMCEYAHRGRQLNHGVRLTKRNWIWFLHADTGFTSGITEHLQRVIEANQRVFHYFSLRFSQPCSPLMRLNEWGVCFRSRVLGLPFGDQGFLMQRELFHDLGAFDEECGFGEDHLFVWKAHRAGVPLNRVPYSLATSARKYERNGWLRTTSLHILRTASQALEARRSE